MVHRPRIPAADGSVYALWPSAMGCHTYIYDSVEAFLFCAAVEGTTKSVATLIDSPFGRDREAAARLYQRGPHAVGECTHPKDLAWTAAFHA